MAFIDLSKKEIQCKVVYYGPGRCGKTTNLLYIYNAMTDRTRGKMLTIETKGDRTLFFDLLPMNLGKACGFDIRLQLYSVPGQSMYHATRKLVLKGVDGLVFVADSLAVRRSKNIESLRELRGNLAELHMNMDEMPLVLQYNKRDLASTPIPTLSLDQMESDLNGDARVPTFQASAIKGPGVFDTLKEISKRTIRHVASKHLMNR